MFEECVEPACLDLLIAPEAKLNSDLKRRMNSEAVEIGQWKIIDVFHCKASPGFLKVVFGTAEAILLTNGLCNPVTYSAPISRPAGTREVCTCCCRFS